MKTNGDKQYCNHLENVAIMLLPNYSRKDISMDTESIRGYEAPLNYCGRILYKQYSENLKKTVSDAVLKFEAFDRLDSPAILYIAAWQDGQANMWYEFAGRGLLRIIGGESAQAACRMRNAVLERRAYKSHDFEAGIRTETLDIHDMDEARAGLRNEGARQGRVEAVYKLMLDTGGVVWLKDVANIRIFPDDSVNLAFGSLTVVSKEMESELKNQRLLAELKNALDKINTLNGMLPICSKCKKIRDDKGYWSQVEDYIRSHSKAEFSHGICPDCARDLYPEVFDPERKTDPRAIKSENGTSDTDDMSDDSRKR